jgi:hypothetical protein
LRLTVIRGGMTRLLMGGFSHDGIWS